MPLDPRPEPTALQAAAHQTLIVSLRNAHALERQVISVLDAQLKLLDDYPDLHARLTEHLVETRDQARRLEAGLEACGASASMFKDALLSVMGMGQSSVQGLAEDAVLKAMLADMMTEHLEIASYRTLIALADLAGKPELRPRLEETLREEQAMADWFDQNLEGITRRFVELKAAKAAADRPADTSPADTTKTGQGKASPTLWQTLEAGRAAEAQTPATPPYDPPPAPEPADPPQDDPSPPAPPQPADPIDPPPQGTTTMRP